MSEHARREARAKIGALEALVKGPVLGARVVLTQERNPRIPDPARAEAELNIQGRLVRARASAPSMDAAVDDVAERLQRAVRRYVDRLVEGQRIQETLPAGEWSHRAWSPPRPPTFDRPVDERQTIRRKSFALDPMSPDDAADTLEDLDDEFLLFHDSRTNADALLYWRDDGLLALIEPRGPDAADGPAVREPSRLPEPIKLETAVAEMDAVAHRFLFFENAATGRANVIYRRYDGHYGLIEPAN